MFVYGVETYKFTCYEKFILATLVGRSVGIVLWTFLSYSIEDVAICHLQVLSSIVKCVTKILHCSGKISQALEFIIGEKCQLASRDICTLDASNASIYLKYLNGDKDRNHWVT